MYYCDSKSEFSADIGLVFVSHDPSESILICWFIYFCTSAKLCLSKADFERINKLVLPVRSIHFCSEKESTCWFIKTCSSSTCSPRRTSMTSESFSLMATEPSRDALTTVPGRTVLLARVWFNPSLLQQTHRSQMSLVQSCLAQTAHSLRSAPECTLLSHWRWKPHHRTS